MKNLHENTDIPINIPLDENSKGKATSHEHANHIMKLILVFVCLCIGPAQKLPTHSAIVDNIMFMKTFPPVYFKKKPTM